MTIQAAEETSKSMGVAEACRVLAVPRSSLYRARKPHPAPAPRPKSVRAISPAEKEALHTILDSERFWDMSPREVYATLLDEGCYYGSVSTMYRLLVEYDEVHERRNQRRHPTAVRPQVRATGPNMVWSWDVTELKGPRAFYHLYTIIDIFSRYVPGWLLADWERATLAEELIAATCAKQGIRREQLTLHADRGSAMRSKTVAELLIQLQVAKSHSRPYTPTDNPYSEAQFKTLKYRPDYPGRFESREEALAWVRAFFQWYNEEHHHVGLGLMTPAAVHYGRAEAIYERRREVLAAAYAAHPERFVRGEPVPPRWSDEVWINRPRDGHRESPHIEPEASGNEPGAQAGSRA